MSLKPVRGIDRLLGVAIAVAAVALVVLLLQRWPASTVAEPPTQAPAAAAPAPDTAADGHFRRGLAALNQRTQESLEAALGAFGEAIKADPLHARAWAGQSMAWFLLPSYGTQDRADAARRCLEAAREAVRLAPDDAMVQTALGAALGIHSVAGPASSEALAAYDLAIAIDPDYATAHHWRAVALTEIGKLAEAESGLRRALALDADLLPARSHLALVLSLQGRWSEALLEGEETLRRAPGQPIHLVQLFLAAAMLDRGPEFADPLRRWLERAGGDAALADRLIAALRDPAQVAGVSADLVHLLDRGAQRGPLLSLLAAIGADGVIADWFAAQPDARAGQRYASSPYARMNRALAEHWRARQSAAPRPPRSE